jgi:protein-tyrosine phosphatase
MRERRVELQGAFNFRDLGGLATVQGATVSLGRVFRSDALHRLTAADAAVLEGLGIARVFDLRSRRELQQDGIGDFVGVRHIHAPLVEVTLSPFDPEIDWGRVDLRTRYVEMLELGGTAIRMVIEATTDEDGPLVFHCTGGKDRTGVVAAVLLRALGVSDETIVEDYALSEVYLRSFLDDFRRDLVRQRFAPEVVGYLTSSPPERMRATLRELDRRWGSTEAYLAWIGVGPHTVERLRAGLLR